jgi:hypothetical protein
LLLTEVTTSVTLGIDQNGAGFVVLEFHASWTPVGSTSLLEALKILANLGWLLWNDVEVSSLDCLAPESEIADNFIGVINFLVFRGLFLNEEVDLLTSKCLASDRSGIHTISSLHSSEDGWFAL